MEMIQNENFLSNDYVNQEYDDQNFNTGKIKRYNDLGNDIPKNINIRSQMNTFNSYSNMNNINNIPQNQTQKQNKLKFQDNQKNTENNNPFLEKEIIPDRTMSYFYGNNFLTDAILKTEEFEIPFHKIVLCSASDFIYNYFSLNKNIQEENQKSIVNLPEIMKSSYSRGNKKECLEKIIKYCYYNQDIKSIESDITQNNCFTLLELSHCLGIKSLNQNLEKLIIKHFLKDDNMIKISEESNNMELPELHKECSNKIKKI